MQVQCRLGGNQGTSPTGLISLLGDFSSEAARERESLSDARRKGGAGPSAGFDVHFFARLYASNFLNRIKAVNKTLRTASRKVGKLLPSHRLLEACTPQRPL